ncbi:hypothetical protein JXR01_03595 [Candidatus Kaiserbacteria bacterium]|nr:MAG: hypothetical protein JXR01_03595 [Candidatus Kaiserbacteria bacterium]
MTIASKIVVGLLSVGAITAVASVGSDSATIQPVEHVRVETRAVDIPDPVHKVKKEVIQDAEPKEVVETKPTSIPAYTPPVSNCHPSYSGCLKANASDYDCAGGSGNGPYYTGTVQVLGPDVFGLDRDKDGWGCE